MNQVTNVLEELMCSNLPRQFISEIEKEILGKSSEIEMILIAFLAGGHVLLEDLPEWENIFGENNIQSVST